jgi:Dolichyl-phosphate-mannose-protein mannosyltransferase
MLHSNGAKAPTLIDKLGAIIAGCAIAGLLLILLSTALIRVYDPDEFQHLEMAWLIANHQVPYKEFFEHHTPLYHVIIAPFIGDMPITNGDAAVGLVHGLRAFAVLLCAAIIALTFVIARKMAGVTAGIFAALLLLTSTIFVGKGVEIRPDQLATLLLLLATLCLMLAGESKRWPVYLFLASGLASASILTTQKALFAVPGLAVTFVALCMHQHFSARDIIRAIVIALIGAMLAALPILTYFYSHGALGDFLTDNFLLGAKWVHVKDPMLKLLALEFREESLLLFLAAIGVVGLLQQGRVIALSRLAIIAPLFPMIALMPLFPVVQHQYVFLFLPYVAVLGGLGAATIVRALGTPPNLFVRPSIVLFLLLLAHGLLVIKTQRDAEDEDAMNRLRYVVEKTPPQATVLRSWSAGVAFRPPAFRYFSLHDEIRAVIPKPEMNALAVEIKNGKVAPEIIEMDKAMGAMPPEILTQLKAGWAPAGVGQLWRRMPTPIPKPGTGAAAPPAPSAH